MKKMAVLLLLASCGADETYTIDGVPVILERGAGPERPHLTFATHLYRQEAKEYWELTPEQERLTWRSIGEIRWTDGPVAHGADYDRSLGVLSANWKGCALAVPLYQALQFAYAEEVTDDDLTWAKDLERASTGAVCVPEDPLLRTPW